MKLDLTGHISFWRITIYGANAMHWAWNIYVFGGYLCIRPLSFQRRFGSDLHWWKPYLYFSPDGTPNKAKWGFGIRRDR